MRPGIGHNTYCALVTLHNTWPIYLARCDSLIVHAQTVDKAFVLPAHYEPEYDACYTLASQSVCAGFLILVRFDVSVNYNEP